MKSLFVLLLIGSLNWIIPTSQAQQAPDSLRTRATETTRQLAGRISLDDARMIQVRRLTYDRLVKEGQVATLYNDDPPMLKNKMRAIEQDYSDNLKAILTESQFQRYAVLYPVTPPDPPAAPATAAKAKPKPGAKTAVKTTKPAAKPAPARPAAKPAVAAQKK